MQATVPAPRRLAALLTLLSGLAVVIFVGTLVLIANSLATTFDRNAQLDAGQRIERGIAAVRSNLAATAYDYAYWTDFYEALQRQDLRWLRVNVASGLDGNDTLNATILGGGPLQTVQGWTNLGSGALSGEDYDAIFAFADQQAEAAGMGYDDGIAKMLLWIRGDLWLVAYGRVWPHTYRPDRSVPTGLMIMGSRLSSQLPRALGDTVLLRDIRVQTAPGPEGASLALDVAQGDPAWLAWTLPEPGSRAISGVFMPIALALVLLLTVLGSGVVIVWRFARDLEAARVTAEAASASKSDFLARMSHEIRTPLNGVMGMAELLDGTSLGPDQREMVQAIRHSGDTLLSLINDILDLSRVEAGKLALETAAFDLTATVDRVAALHAVTAREKGVGLTVDCTGLRPGQRMGDDLRLQQILHNVIGNAVKFTDAGQVRLQVAEPDPDVVTLRVRDTGIGMSPAELARFFEAFEQADVATARRYGGTGLGMSIVQRLVDLMGGRVEVSSTPGTGTEVVIRLPLPRAAAPAGHAGQEAPSLPRRPIPAGTTLLVADDNATNRRLLALMLDRMGVQAEFATDGAEAVALWKARSFGLVLMDISMPGMNGLEALAAMRDHSRRTGRASPVAVAASANVMKEQVDGYLAAGFTDVLPKPLRRAALEAVVLQHLAPAPAVPAGPPG